MPDLHCKCLKSKLPFTTNSIEVVLNKALPIDWNSEAVIECTLTLAMLWSCDLSTDSRTHVDAF